MPLGVFGGLSIFLGPFCGDCDNCGVDSGEKRRKHERVPLSEAAPTVFLSVRVVFEGHHGVGRIVNIAEEGIFLQTDVALPKGTSASLRLLLASGSLCAAEGSVVWLAKSRVGVGIRLSEPNQEFREFVRLLAAAESAKELFALIRDVREADIRFH